MIQPTTKDIIRIVRTYAYQNGITITQFAKKADVSKSWISRLKNEDSEISLQLAKQLLETAGYKIIIKHQSNIDSDDTKEIKTLTDEQIKELEKQKKKK
ncbi:CII-like regulator [Bacillus phage G]|uniref:Gp679 n=1 Tax=Bacillus phage G TaxID=2884420 RepID=G3MB59_9CAUD|nr:CII-like regulator [Bacillus phage G]AEO93922.1 gp679 [Bacillus phage G]